VSKWHSQGYNGIPQDDLRWSRGLWGDWLTAYKPSKGYAGMWMIHMALTSSLTPIKGTTDGNNHQLCKSSLSWHTLDGPQNWHIRSSSATAICGISEFMVDVIYANLRLHQNNRMNIILVHQPEARVIWCWFGPPNLWCFGHTYTPGAGHRPIGAQGCEGLVIPLADQGEISRMFFGLFILNLHEHGLFSPKHEVVHRSRQVPSAKQPIHVGLLKEIR